MSKPAARMGDTTIHGGTLVVGQPTVLIGGMPAARLGDMHVCPMATPAVPPVPHVGGPVTLGSAGVLIGGMPAARMGDMCVCTGPPDTIAMGCPTVLIGEVGAGAASGGGAGGGGGAAAARASAAAATIDTGVSTTQDEHWIAFQFVDSAGLPVAGVPYAFTDPDGAETEGVLRTDGRLRADGVSEGQGEVVLRSVHAARWEKAEARTDESVRFSARTSGFENGTPATVQIVQSDLHGADVVVQTVSTYVQQGAIEGEYVFAHLQTTDRKVPLSTHERHETYSAPRFYFEVIVDNCTARSGFLEYQDYLEIELRNEQDEAVPRAEYFVQMPHGGVRTGKLDADGFGREDNLPPGKCLVQFTNLTDQ
jgi:uncharacterized Zn-binding protein involved in type VI secretion